MKFLKNTILIVSTGMVFVTCKKEEISPSSVQGGPAFSFSGTIGGNSLSMQAGVNNYYMYSSYTHDTNNIYNFTANLRNTGTNANSIQITINDDTVKSSSQLSDINKSITATGYYPYNVPGGIPVFDSVHFTPRIYSGTPSQFIYDFGDSTGSNRSSPTHYYKLNTTVQTYTTTLAVEFPCGTKNLSNSVDIGKQLNELKIDSVVATVSQNYQVSFRAYIENGQPPYLYGWSYKGNPYHLDTTVTKSGTADTVNYTYPVPNQTYTLVFGVMDSHKNEVIYYNYNFTDANAASCRIDDYFVSTPQPVPNPKKLSSVTMTYTDANGALYSSNNPNQPSSSTFQITSVSNYQNNEKNQPTKMLQVQFNCMLYNLVNGVALPANGTAVIAVAYH